MARLLLLHVCDQMMEWASRLHQETDIDEYYFVQDEAPAEKGISHSILMDVRPVRNGNQYLSGLLLFDAVRAFKSLVRRHGALHGSFQIWENGRLRAVSMVSIIEWPPARAVAA